MYAGDRPRLEKSGEKREWKKGRAGPILKESSWESINPPPGRGGGAGGPRIEERFLSRVGAEGPERGEEAGPAGERVSGPNWLRGHEKTRDDGARE